MTVLELKQLLSDEPDGARVLLSVAGVPRDMSLISLLSVREKRVKTLEVPTMEQVYLNFDEDSSRIPGCGL